MTRTHTCKFQVERNESGAPSRNSLAPGRLPRVTRLLALAHYFNELLESGEVSSQAELAEQGQVSRPRLTQIMNLLNLSPAIQDQILFHPPVTNGRDPISERSIRQASAKLSWEEQQKTLASSGIR